MSASLKISKMKSQIKLTKSENRACMLYDFKSGLTAAESQQRLCDAFGQGCVSQRNVRLHFQRFRNGDFDTEDKPRSGRPGTVDDERLLELVDMDPYLTAREIAETMGASHTSIINHLHANGKVSRLDRWVPHTLSVSVRQRRVDAAVSLLSYSRRTHWLDTIVTGDEKWCLYTNIKRRRSWSDVASSTRTQAKADLHPRKVMISVWWDSSGVIYWELLPPNFSINAQVYCEQLDRLAQAISELRSNLSHIRFLHDNARPHTARVTSQKLLNLGWEVLIHPPYSPDMAPTDYHLFLTLARSISGMSFEGEGDLKKWLIEFFASKPKQFYRDGIHSLLERWRYVVDYNGDYYTD